MNYKIREILKSDYLEVAVLYKKLKIYWREYMFDFYANYRKGAEMKSDSDVALNVIKKKHLEKNSKFLVLEVDNKVVWFIYGTLFRHEDWVYKINDLILWELKHIFIDEIYRWKWFSIILRDSLFEWFIQNNVKVVEIWVNPDNPVFKIYKKWGFNSKYCFVSKEL